MNPLHDDKASDDARRLYEQIYTLTKNYDIEISLFAIEVTVVNLLMKQCLERRSNLLDALLHRLSTLPEFVEHQRGDWFQ